MRFSIYLLGLYFLFGCTGKNVENKEQGKQINDNPTIDTLKHYESTQKSLPPQLYKDIFKKELSDIDTAKIIEIRKEINNYTPVIELFSTIHSDQKEDFEILDIFDKNGKLLLTYSLKYNIDYDLFQQDYTFENDSIIKITQKHGLNYENQDHVLKTLKLELKPKIILDTLSIQIDTILEHYEPYTYDTLLKGGYHISYSVQKDKRLQMLYLKKGDQTIKKLSETGFPMLHKNLGYIGADFTTYIAFLQSFGSGNPTYLTLLKKSNGKEILKGTWVDASEEEEVLVYIENEHQKNVTLKVFDLKNNKFYKVDYFNEHLCVKEKVEGLRACIKLKSVNSKTIKLESEGDTFTLKR